MSDTAVILFALFVLCLMIGVPLFIIIAAQKATKNEPNLQPTLRQKAYRTIKWKRAAIVFIVWIAMSFVASFIGFYFKVPVLVPGTLTVWIVGGIWISKANDIVFDKPFADEI